MAFVQSSSLRGVSGRRLSIAKRLRMMLALRKSRAQLAALTDDQLADIGVSRDQATAESQRAPWDGHEYWVKRTF